MSDFSRRPTRPRRPRRPGRFGNQLTPYQQQLVPYIQQVKGEEEEEKRRIRPVAGFFDLLQRGQYFTANIAQELINSARKGEDLSERAKNAALGALRGLTGKQKGTWQDVFFGKVPEEERKFGHKVAGFAADVLLDPLTYLTLGTGAAAKSAASVFARTVLSETIQKTAKEAGKEFLQNMGEKQGAKWVGDIYSRALKDASVLSRQKLLDKYKGKLGQEVTENILDKTLKEDLGQMAGRQFLRPPKEGGELAERTREELLKLREGATDPFGRGAARMMGKTVFEYGNRPLAKFWNEMGEKIGRSPAGEKLSNAWWTVMNTGVVGNIRKAFGFGGSPYQNMLRLKNRELDSGYHKLVSDQTMRIQKLFAGLDEVDKDLLRSSISKAYEVVGETLEAGGRTIDGDLFINARDIILRDAKDPNQGNRILEAYKKLKATSEDWRNIENQIYKEGNIERAVNLEINYLPTFKKTASVTGVTRPGKQIGTSKPSFTEKKVLSPEAAYRANKAYLRAVWGPDYIRQAREDAIRTGEITNVKMTDDQYLDYVLKNKNQANISLDLEEAYAYRAMLHARAVTRSNMINQFKEFGIPISDISGRIPGKRNEQEVKDLAGFLQSTGAGIKGLSSSKDPSLQGYLFDDDLAEIINRTHDAANTDEGLKGMRDFWSWFTSVWKGWATMTPRFHMRNAVSNHMQGFLKHGWDWMNPASQVKALVGTSYGLNRNKYYEFLKGNMDLTPTQAKMMLETTVGGLTIRELAEIALEKDVISQRTMGFDVEQTIGELLGRDTLEKSLKKPETYNPASRDFLGFRLSRGAGNIIENHARFMSFIKDFERAGGVNTPGALEYASNEAKKWFLDYGDLTQFEQKVMKNVIPFYTWLRKNIANQLSGLVLYRDMYSIIPKTIGVFAKDEDFDYELMPEWMQDEGFFPISTEKEGRRMLLQPEMAVMDLNMLPITFDRETMLPKMDLKDTSRTITSSAHPIIKTIAEVVTGRDFFRDKNIKGGRYSMIEIGGDEPQQRGRTFTMEIAPTILQFFAKSPKVLNFLDGFMRMSGFSEGIGVDVARDDNRVVMDARAQRILDNNLPGLRTLAEVIESIEEGVKVVDPEFEEAIERVSGKVDYYEGMNELFRTIAFYFGVRLKEYEQEVQADRRREDIYRESEKLLQTQRRYLPGYQNRSEDYWKRRRGITTRQVGS